MFWYLLAKDLGCNNFENQSRPGSSNDLIIQRVYDHALSNPGQSILYIINLTSLNRIEIEANRSEKIQEILVPDALMRYDFETVELTAYSQLIGVISFLESRDLKYIVVNNSKGFTKGPWHRRDNFVDFINSRKNILNLYDDSRVEFHQYRSKIKPYDYNLWGWNGHDGPEGHFAYYQMLKSKLKQS